MQNQTFGVDVGKNHQPQNHGKFHSEFSQTCRKRRVCGRRAPTTTTVWVSPVKKVKRRASRFGSVALTAVVSLDAVRSFWISGGKKDGQKSSPL